MVTTLLLYSIEQTLQAVGFMRVPCSERYSLLWQHCWILLSGPTWALLGQAWEARPGAAPWAQGSPASPAPWHTSLGLAERDTPVGTHRLVLMKAEKLVENRSNNLNDNGRIGMTPVKLMYYMLDVHYKCKKCIIWKLP